MVMLPPSLFVEESLRPSLAFSSMRLRRGCFLGEDSTPFVMDGNNPVVFHLSRPPHTPLCVLARDPCSLLWAARLPPAPSAALSSLSFYKKAFFRFVGLSDFCFFGSPSSAACMVSPQLLNYVKQLRYLSHCQEERARAFFVPIPSTLSAGMTVPLGHALAPLRPFL